MAKDDFTLGVTDQKLILNQGVSSQESLLSKLQPKVAILVPPWPHFVAWHLQILRFNLI